MRSSRFTRTPLAAALTSALAACGSHHPAPAVIGPLEGNSFVVRDVRVFDGERAIERTNIVVRDGRVASVGTSRPPRDLPVIEGTGRTLFPGLIDSHAHVQSEAALRNALRFGVTTELDMFTFVEFAQSQRPRRESMARTDLADLYSAGAPVTSPGGMGTQFGIAFPTISGPEEAPAFVRARLAEGSDYIKILYEPNAGIVTTISYETLVAVVAAAHAEGALAVVHVTSLEGARGAVAARADGLVHLFSDALIDDALVRQMAEQSMFVTPTLSIYAAFRGAGIGPQLAADPRLAPYLSDAQKRQLAPVEFDPNSPMAPYLERFDLQRALENTRRLHATGVRLLAGDDVPNLAAHGASMHGELELLTRAGLTPAEALKAATAATAEAYRLPERGRIVPGARADLVLVDGNPLIDITATRAIVRVFKNGYEVSRPPEAPAPLAAPATETP